MSFSILIIPFPIGGCLNEFNPVFVRCLGLSCFGRNRALQAHGSKRALFFATDSRLQYRGIKFQYRGGLARYEACSDYRSTCADCRSGRGVSSLSRATCSPLASSPLDRLVRFSGEIDSGNCKALLPRPGYSVVNGWGRSQLFVSLGYTTRSVVQRKAIFGLKHRKAK